MGAPACAGVELEVFFPSGTGTTVYAEARSYCTRCPLKAQCLAMAMESEHSAADRHGMFGGLTPNERERLSNGDRRCVICDEPVALQAPAKTCGPECWRVHRTDSQREYMARRRAA